MQPSQRGAKNLVVIPLWTKAMLECKRRNSSFFLCASAMDLHIVRIGQHDVAELIQ